MAANLVDLSIYQGDDPTWIVTVRNPDGTPANITGYTALAQIRRSPADTDPVVAATITATIASPHVNLSLSHTITADLEGRYVWDLQLTSTTNIVSTIMAGRVAVTAEVSRIAA